MKKTFFKRNKLSWNLVLYHQSYLLSTNIAQAEDAGDHIKTLPPQHTVIYIHNVSIMLCDTIVSTLHQHCIYIVYTHCIRHCIHIVLTIQLRHPKLLRLQKQHNKRHINHPVMASGGLPHEIVKWPNLVGSNEGQLGRPHMVCGWSVGELQDGRNIPGGNHTPGARKVSCSFIFVLFLD